MTTVKVEGAGPTGSPNKSWRDTVAADMKNLNLRPSDAANKSEWRQAMYRDPSNVGVPGRNEKPDDDDDETVHSMLEKTVEAFQINGFNYCPAW